MKRALAMFVLGGLIACRHVAAGADLSAELSSHPGSYLAGSIAAATPESPLDRRDFVYDLAFDATSSHVAYSHLAAKVFRVAIVEAEPMVPTERLLSDEGINSNEIDVEALAFAPDGKRVAVASHDRSVRLIDLAGHIVAQASTEEPLTAVAFAPDGRAVVVGSESGLLTVLQGDDLSYQSELHAHHDSVHGLAFDDHGVLWSGAYDQQVHAYTLASDPAVVNEVRLHLRKVGSVSAITATASGPDGGADLTLAVDERSEVSAITPEAAMRMGIDSGFLKEHIEQMTPAGKVDVPLARDRTLRFKALVIPHVDLAICGNCVLPGVDGVVGRGFLAAHPLVIDEATHEVVLHTTPDASAPPGSVLTLHVAKSYAMPGLVADLTVSRDGTRLGVALDETKPVRTLALYQREKQGQVDPVRPGNIAAIVDAQTGALVEKHNAHAGVVSTAAISPDGRSLASGGWDRNVFVYSGSQLPVATVPYGWCVRRVRFSPDGRLLGVGAWTPQNAQNADSDPAAQMLKLDYPEAKVVGP